jgi:hypothetical protein
VYVKVIVRELFSWGLNFMLVPTDPINCCLVSVNLGKNAHLRQQQACEDNKRNFFPF